jgi:hypothetical protein
MWPINRPPHWVGRAPELAALRAAAEALGRGEGTVAWVEGEPCIGKSSLVAEALAAASDPGLDIRWGVADKLTERLPLRRTPVHQPEHRRLPPPQGLPQTRRNVANAARRPYEIRAR